MVNHGLSKGVILCPTKKNIAAIIFQKLYTCFGLFDKVISDHSPQFTTNFARELSPILGYKISLSTAYHPQTDRETKKLKPTSTSSVVPTLKHGLNTFPWQNLSTITAPILPPVNPHSTSCWGTNHKLSLILLKPLTFQR